MLHKIPKKWKRRIFKDDYLNIHALKNNASVIINYESDTIVTVKGSDGSLVNTAHFRKVLAMNNDSLD